MKTDHIFGALAFMAAIAIVLFHQVVAQDQAIKNVEYISGADPYETSVKVSQYIYNESQPGVVILVRADDSGYADALAASALTHHPRNGPILFTAADSIPDVTIKEIKRLQSLNSSNKVKAIAVGGLSENVTGTLKTLGLPVETINGSTPYETAYLIDELLGFPGIIIIASPQDGGMASPAAAWSAHFGTPVLFIDKGSIPGPTLKAINRTYMPEIYIMGGEDVISRGVEDQFRSLGVKSVDRIGGNNASEVSVNLASYKKGYFGWGKTSDAENAFSIVQTGSWQDAISAALLAHLNRHMPILVTAPDKLDMSVASYLDSINQPNTPVPDYAIVVGKGVSRDVEAMTSNLMVGKKSVTMS